MHNLLASDRIKEVMNKLSRKDIVLYNQLLKKIEEIVNCSDIDHYKNLRYDMKDSKRVHVGHFVLVFQYNKQTDTIYLDDFDHHSNIYNRRG